MTHESRRPGDRLALSVVIVTYNEEDRIRECIESVISAGRGLADFEVILVDSNSTDRTVDVAAEYPITLLRIPDDELTTPGAGRYVGTDDARGELVLFVDGDMTIEREWLARALTVLCSREDVAAVDGHLNAPSSAETITEVDAVRGVALYKREALQSVGGFDPSLRSLEDIHLGYELTAAGYTLLRLPEMAAIHPSRESVFEPLRRWQCGYAIGPGQAIRKSARSRHLLAKHLYRIRHRLGLVAWLCAGVGALVFSSLFLFWLGLSAVAGGVLGAKLGVRGGVGFLATKLLGVVGLVKGLFVPPQPHTAFPLEVVERLQQGTVFVATPSGPDAGQRIDR